jgi:hypothetical protein
VVNVQCFPHQKFFKGPVKKKLKGKVSENGNVEIRVIYYFLLIYIIGATWM